MAQPSRTSKLAAVTPILNGPYSESLLHYATDVDGSLNYVDHRDGRRTFAPQIPQVPIGVQPQLDIALEWLPAAASQPSTERRAIVEIRGLDIYDPIRDEVKGRSVADIAYWMVDEAYNGSDFIPTQVFFCGGEADPYDKFKRGLTGLMQASTKKAAEKTLKIEIDDEAFDRVYGFRSHPITASKGSKVAVRVISQFGEESTKVLTL